MKLIKIFISVIACLCWTSLDSYYLTQVATKNLNQVIDVVWFKFHGDSYVGVLSNDTNSSTLSMYEFDPSNSTLILIDSSSVDLTARSVSTCIYNANIECAIAGSTNSNQAGITFKKFNGTTLNDSSIPDAITSGATISDCVHYFTYNSNPFIAYTARSNNTNKLIVKQLDSSVSYIKILNGTTSIKDSTIDFISYNGRSFLAVGQGNKSGISQTPYIYVYEITGSGDSISFNLVGSIQGTNRQVHTIQWYTENSNLYLAVGYYDNAQVSYSNVFHVSNITHAALKFTPILVDTVSLATAVIKGFDASFIVQNKYNETHFGILSQMTGINSFLTESSFSGGTYNALDTITINGSGYLVGVDSDTVHFYRLDASPPHVNDDTIHVALGESLTKNLTSNYVVGDLPLNLASLMITQCPQGGGAVSFTNHFDGTITVEGVKVGTTCMKYKISDIYGNVSNEATINIQVTSTKKPVLSNNDSVTTQKNTAISIDVLANDTAYDGKTLNPVSVSVINQPMFGVATNIDSVTGNITYEPNPDFIGTDKFVYQVCDSANLCSSAHVEVNVAEAPIAPHISTAVAPNKKVSINTLAYAIKGTAPLDPKSVCITVAPVKGGTKVDPITGRINYSAPSTIGLQQGNYEIADINGFTSSAMISINVTHNEPLVANAETAKTAYETAKVINVVKNDTSSGIIDPASVTIVHAPSHGTALSNGDGTVTYTPHDNFSGTDSFTYSVQDSNFFSDTAVVTIAVGEHSSNTAVAVNKAVTTMQNKPVSIDVVAAGQNLDPTSIIIVNQPNSSIGTTSINPITGAINFKPASNFFGTTKLMYQGTNAQGFASNVGIITITVNTSSGLLNNMAAAFSRS